MVKPATVEDVERFKKMASEGKPATEIAKETGFDRGTICEKLKTEGYTWSRNRWIKTPEDANGGTIESPLSPSETSPDGSVEPEGPPQVPPAPVGRTPPRPAIREPSRAPLVATEPPKNVLPPDSEAPFLKGPERTSWFRRKRLTELMTTFKLKDDNINWMLMVWDSEPGMRTQAIQLEEALMAHGGIDIHKARFIVKAVFTINEDVEVPQPYTYPGPYGGYPQGPPPQQQSPYPSPYGQQGQACQYPQPGYPQQAPSQQGQWAPPPWQPPYPSPPYYPPQEKPLTQADLDRVRQEERDKVEREDRERRSKEEREALEKRLKETEERMRTMEADLIRAQRDRGLAAEQGRVRIIRVPITLEDGSVARDPKTNEIIVTEEIIPLSQGPITREELATIVAQASAGKSAPETEEAKAKNKELEDKLDKEREARRLAELKALEESNNKRIEEMKAQNERHHLEQMKLLELQKASADGRASGWREGYADRSDSAETEEFRLAKQKQDVTLKIVERKAGSIERKFDRFMDYMMGQSPPPDTPAPDDEAKKVLEGHT